MKKVTRQLLVTFAFLSVVLAFQNCSEVDFRKSAEPETRLTQVDQAELPGEPPLILSHPSGDGATLGQGFQMDVVAYSEAPLSYQWYLNQSPIAGETQSQLNFANLVIDDEGNYSVQVSNEFGSVMSDLATLSLTGSLVPGSNYFGCIVHSDGNGVDCRNPGTFNFEIPLWVKAVKVNLVGGGGGGAGGVAWTSNGGAGGGAGAAEKTLDVTPGARVRITVARGGRAGSRGGHGGSGGTSSFAGMVSATGGGGGLVGSSGGSGGYGVNGDVNQSGQRGANAPAYCFNCSYTYYGGRAASSLGGAGGNVNQAGRNYGGGGGAGEHNTNGEPGAAGASGIVRISW